MNTAVIAEIRAELARRGMTQQQLGEAIGRPQDWVSRRLSGRVALTTDEVGAIAVALGIPPGRLFSPANHQP